MSWKPFPMLKGIGCIINNISLAPSCMPDTLISSLTTSLAAVSNSQPGKLPPDSRGFFCMTLRKAISDQMLSAPSAPQQPREQRRVVPLVACIHTNAVVQAWLSGCRLLFQQVWLRRGVNPRQAQ